MHRESVLSPMEVFRWQMSGDSSDLRTNPWEALTDGKVREGNSFEIQKFFFLIQARKLTKKVHSSRMDTHVT